MHVSVV